MDGSIPTPNTALLHEIAGAKTRRSDLETEVLVCLEEEEEIQRQKPAIERALAEAEREAAERLAMIDREEREHGERLAALDQERARELEGVSPPVRARYERVHASKEGRAIVAISKDACGGCFRGQPPQQALLAAGADSTDDARACIEQVQ